MKRELKFNKETNKYVLKITSDIPLKDGKTTVGHQYQTLEQIWDKDAIPAMLKTLEDQETQMKIQLKEQEKKLKEIHLSDREKQKIKVFAENLKKAQDLQKIEQYETAIDNLNNALVKLAKDKKELTDAIKEVQNAEK